MCQGFWIVIFLASLARPAWGQVEFPGGIGGYPPTTSGPYGGAPDVAALGLNKSDPYFGKMVENSSRRGGASFDIALTDPLIAPRKDGGPEQVILTQGDYDGNAFVLSWATPDEKAPSVVRLGLRPDSLDKTFKATQRSARYIFADYSSPFFHHVNLTGLQGGTSYYYEIGEGAATFKGSFVTPPSPGPDSPMLVGVVGDLGQTYASNVTLWHLQESGATYTLFAGDFSYADNYEPRWDTWGRLVTRFTSRVPFMYTYGNHEIEYQNFLGPTEQDPPYGFKPVGFRVSAPYGFYGEDPSNTYYSFNAGPMHVVMLNSYYPFVKYTPQNNWLQEDLARANKNRKNVPWLFLVVHTPFYNTYSAHFQEGESIRTELERLIRFAKVDAVFSGHVHAYERFERVYQYKLDPCAPVYITIGDGGNREGAYRDFAVNPQPAYSAMRMGSFGHGLLRIMNRTTAVWEWHRNYRKENTPAGAVVPETEVADQVVLKNLFYDPPGGVSAGICGKFGKFSTHLNAAEFGTYPPGTSPVHARGPVQSQPDEDRAQLQPDSPKDKHSHAVGVMALVLTAVGVAALELLIVLGVIFVMQRRAAADTGGVPALSVSPSVKVDLRGYRKLEKLESINSSTN